MQKALKEDEELAVLCTTGAEPVRVVDIFLPSWSVAVLTGIDADKAVTRVACAVEQSILTCKVVKAPVGSKPSRIRIIAPKT